MRRRHIDLGRLSDTTMAEPERALVRPIFVSRALRKVARELYAFLIFLRRLPERAQVEIFSS